jgi:two-component system phosphate regulon response regulator PhoB
MMNPKVLIIDSDRALSRELAQALERDNLDVVVSGEGQDGLNLIRAKRPDLVVLDLALPRKDGWEICRELRADEPTRKIPLVITTARADESEQLIGFALGADDYVIKPYSIKVLIARIRYQLRRALRGGDTDSRTIECQGVLVDNLRYSARYLGRELRLTPTEFRLLQVLLRHPGRAFTRGELRRAVSPEPATISDDRINAYINGLRSKLGEAAHLIETVRFIGYRFREPSLVDCGSR